MAPTENVMPYLTLEVDAGDRIRYVSEKAVTMANNNDVQIVFWFNGVLMPVFPGDDADNLVADYYEAAREEYGHQNPSDAHEGNKG